ncbi:MAG: hypothetical protein AAB359_00455, partial [Elusimicrobiota bacterium]
ADQPNILILLTRMEEGEDRDELINLALAPALAKIVSIMNKAKNEKGISVYLPLSELLLEFVKSAAPGANALKARS